MIGKHRVKVEQCKMIFRDVPYWHLAVATRMNFLLLIWKLCDGSTSPDLENTRDKVAIRWFPYCVVFVRPSRVLQWWWWSCWHMVVGVCYFPVLKCVVSATKSNFVRERRCYLAAAMSDDDRDIDVESDVSRFDEDVVWSILNKTMCTCHFRMGTIRIHVNTYPDRAATVSIIHR